MHFISLDLNNLASYSQRQPMLDEGESTIGLHHFDLKRFREEKLRLTQEELARQLGIRQDQVSRLEKNPGNMTVDMFLAIWTIAGMTPDQGLQFTLPSPGPLEVCDPYRKLRERRRLLEDYLRPWREKLARAAAQGEAGNLTGERSRLLAEP